MEMKFEILKPNEVYAITREDGLSIAVTREPSMIAEIISDEFCQAKVKIDRIEYNKQNYSYNIFATIFEDGDDEGCEYEFTMIPTHFYQSIKLVHDHLIIADIFKSDVSEQIQAELHGRHTYLDRHSLREHLYSVELLDEEEEPRSKELEKFIDLIQKESPEAAYFRLI